MNSRIPIIIAAIALLSVAACESGPKVISAPTSGEQAANNQGVSESGSAMSPFANPPATPTGELHGVVIQEVLPTERYVYLRVTEGEEEFWLATRKMEVVKGGTYYYRDGLLKTNFESKEYNRVFEKVYLVSNLVPEKHGGDSGTPIPVESHGPAEGAGVLSSGGDINRAGSVKIADIVKNPQAYEGKKVQVSGVCVKINPNIMGRNWIHLQDGSQDDYDFVVTSNSYVAEGAVVSLEAVVGIDRDFGAGYRYSLILENGKVLE